jgi:thioredoxin reductase (NADPH)
MASESLDIIIIGGGPIGLACALEAQKAGLSYRILEKGCLVNSMYHYPANMTFFSTSELLEVGGIPFVSNNPKPTRPEALEYYRRVATSGRLKVNLFEKVLSVTAEARRYRVRTEKGVYDATYVVIATGFYDKPNRMNIPGEDLPKVRHYYKEPHFYAMQRVIVVGANNSAADAALETWRKGAQVTMVIRGEGIGKRVKYWKKPDIENRIKEGCIKAFTHSTLAAVREHEADILTPGGLLTVPNDYVIAMTGYQPDFEFLEATGIALSDDDRHIPAYDPDTMETNRENIFLAGVVCGGMNTHLWFIENSREHARKILDCIVKKNAPKVSGAPA